MAWPRLPGTVAGEIHEYLLPRAPLDQVEIGKIVNLICVHRRNRDISRKEARTMAVRELAKAYLIWKSGAEPDVRVKFLLDVFLASRPAAERPRMEQLFEAAIPVMGLARSEAFFLRCLMTFGPISLAGRNGFNKQEISQATGIPEARVQHELTRACDILAEHMRGLTTEESDR